ncbi:hypothetical protein GUITHDRAFT_149141, partial [Guillardia theta CCMP2712]
MDERSRMKQLLRSTEQLVVEHKIPEDMLETVSGRVKTFHLTWKGAITGRLVQFPIERLKPLTIERLAWAGLYYLPDAKIEDRTVCFKCGRAMFSWQSNDDPLYEHVKFNPNCEYVQSIGDDNFKLDHTDASALRAEDETSERVDETETAEEKIDWNSITEDLPRDAVI